MKVPEVTLVLDTAEMRGVRQVEELGAELRLARSLIDEFARDIEIGVPDAGIAQNVASAGAESLTSVTAAKAVGS